MFENLGSLHDVHAAILGICTAIALGVFGMMLRSIASFRTASQGGMPALRRKVLEILWAIVPIVIVAAAAMPAMRPLVSGGETLSAEISSH